MSLDRHTPPAGRIEVPDRPEWGPLLRLVGSSLCAQFMAMGQVRRGETTKSSESTTIFLYKHIRTRRYLNLAWHGQAYRYTREGTYTPITLTEAILWVLVEHGAETPWEGQCDVDLGAGPQLG